MSEPEAKPHRVLVVDDDDDTSVLLGIVLGRHGYVTTFVSDLPDARSALETGDFAALVTDLSLPGGSGLSLLSNDRPATLRAAVVMSGAGAAADRRESERRGFDAYLVKPFDAAELAVLLARLLGPEETSLPLTPAERAQDLQARKVEEES
jgi:DNA-binding response OmpR family regulator